MPQIVWTARPDGFVDYYNRRWYDYTGLAEGDPGYETWRPILHPDDMEPTLNLWHSSLASGRPWEMQSRFRDRKNDSWRWHLGRALPLRDEQGNVAKWVGTFTDIDDHKRLSEELEQRVAA